MTQLYDPETFEPLTDTPWNEARVADAIQAIAAAAEDAFDEKELWPAGEWESWNTPLPLKNLYIGAAGVLWALHALRGRDRTDGALDLGERDRARPRGVDVRARPDARHRTPVHR